MKLAIFSDLHSHAFAPYATILPNGLNSRLMDAVGCIDQIAAYCADPANQIDAVLFGGDLFHVRKNIAVAAFNATFYALSKFKEVGIPLVMIHGNHDQASKDGSVNSIETFKTIATIIDKPGWIEVTGKSGQHYSILGIPYTENLEQLKDAVNSEMVGSVENPRILLGHMGIQGAKVGADFVYSGPHDAKIEDLKCSFFDRVYLGHYHMHQQLAANACYVGAPLMHNWGDKDQWRGFLVYDPCNDSHMQVSLQAPKFVEYDFRDKNAKKLDYKDNFVRFISPDYWTQDQIEETKATIGSRSLEIVPPSVPAFETAVQRLPVSINTDIKEAVTSFVRSYTSPIGNLEEDYLLSLGMDILDEIE